MSLIIQKYGGTSVGSMERISHVADKVAAAVQRGDSVVVVLSAMSGETDRLMSLARQASSSPDSRELDVLLATGEQVTVALLSMALLARGYQAKSYTGAQVQIQTDDVHTKARILSIDDRKMKSDLQQGKVIVVAGFQGCDQHGNITTLGRGGSDTTAVAIAAALQADECQIFTDVDGVFTTDPRVVPEARLLSSVTFEEMLELASLGAKVLQLRAVEFAGRYKVPLRVLNTFKDGAGTLIALEESTMEHPLVSGIAFNRDEAKLTLRGVPDKPGSAFSILGPISAANIDVDMIIQNAAAADDSTDFTFTVHRTDYEKATLLLEQIAQEMGAQEVIGDKKIAKVSLVGVGMRSHAGIASTMFATLAKEGVNIKLIATSEIKVSIVVDEKYLELAVRALHAAFQLESEPEQEKIGG